MSLQQGDGEVEFTDSMKAKLDELKANPTPTGNDINYRDCENDDSSSDAYGDTCSSWYDSYESPGSSGCNGAYDTDDFNAASQCCACQGGRSESDMSMKLKIITNGNGDPAENARNARDPPPPPTMLRAKRVSERTQGR